MLPLGPGPPPHVRTSRTCNRWWLNKCLLGIPSGPRGTFSRPREVPLLLHHASARTGIPGAGLPQPPPPPGSLPGLAGLPEPVSLSLCTLYLLYTDIDSWGTPCEHLTSAFSVFLWLPHLLEALKGAECKNSWSQGLVFMQGPSLRWLEGREICSLLSCDSPDPLILMRKRVSCCHSPAASHS